MSAETVTEHNAWACPCGHAANGASCGGCGGTEQQAKGWRHTFRCVVCGKPGECADECDRDPATHVHFAQPCWENFRD